MLPIRIKACSESDLRMLGDLARNIQRVLPVTQADIDAAAALGKGWVVWKVIEVNDPIDNLRGGTQLVIKQNSITPGQNVRRVLIVQGPGGETVVIGPGPSPLLLPDAIADSLSYVKAFGGTEQRNIPDNYIERQFIYMMDGSYLLTDIVPTYDCKTEMDFATTSLASSGSFLGGRTASSPAGMNFGFTAGKFVLDAFSSSRYTSDIAPVANTRYKFTFNNKVATLESGGTTLFTNTFTGEDANGAALAINALNSAGSITGNTSGIYLYSFKVWNAQGELVADYVPAVQKGTVPVVGFYDTVSKTFKTATAGTLAAGPEAVPTPTQPLSLVSNNGVLKYGKPIMLDSTRYYAYLSVNLTDWSYSSDSYSIPIPVTVGHKYKITVPATNPLNGAQNVIFRYAFADSINTDWTSSTATGQTSIPAYDMVRTTPQDTPSVEVTATHPYLIMQMGAGIFGYILTNNLITITEQSIYTDGTVETINVHGKNLFDKTTYIAGKYYNSSGNIVENPNYGMSGFIPMKSGQTFALSGRTPSGIAIFNTSQVWQQQVTGQSFTAPYDGYFVVSVAAGQQDTLQVEQGSTATAYQPYFNGGTATAEMLLKVGDYQDVQSIIDGTVTRNVGVKVLDGTEDWEKGISSFYVDGAITDMASTDTAYTVICSHYKGVSSSSPSAEQANKNTTRFLNSSQYPNRINIFAILNDYATAGDFKAFLADQYNAGTPVIVIYPLATPTTESVTGQTLQVTDGDNVLEITQASLSNLELEAEYETNA